MARKPISGAGLVIAFLVGGFLIATGVLTFFMVDGPAAGAYPGTLVHVAQNVRSHGPAPRWQ